MKYNFNPLIKRFFRSYFKQCDIKIPGSVTSPQPRYVQGGDVICLMHTSSNSEKYNFGTLNIVGICVNYNTNVNKAVNIHDLNVMTLYMYVI